MSDAPVTSPAAAASRVGRRKRPRRKVAPGLLRAADAADFCGVGRSTFDRWNADGLAPAPAKVAGAIVWGRLELREWCRRGCPPRDQWQAVWAAILAAEGRRPPLK